MFQSISKSPTSSPPTPNPPATRRTGTKITYDSTGKVVSSTYLSATDIPSLEVEKISGLQTILDGLLPSSPYLSQIASLTPNNNDVLIYNSAWTNINLLTLGATMGLGTAAYTSSADYASSSHSHSLLGDVTGPLSATSITNLSLSKLQSITSSKLLGRGDASNGIPQEITLGSGLSMTGTTLSASGTGGTVTSVGLTMPSAFTVGSSPVTTSGTIAVTGAGTTSDYIRGDGTLAAFPSIPSGAALTKVDDTNVTLTLGGSPSTALINAASLTLGWSGQLSVPRGGLNLSTVSQGDLLYGSASNTYSLLAKNTTATRYLSNTGTSNNPAWAQIDLTNGVTGDLPFANITQLAGLSVAGRSANSTGDIAAITASSDHNVLRRSGTTLAFGAINLASTSAVSGILPGGNGGTGASSFGAANRIPYASSTTVLTNSANLTYDGSRFAAGQTGSVTAGVDLNGYTTLNLGSPVLSSTFRQMRFFGTPSTATNNITYQQIYLGGTISNDGTPTGGSVQSLVVEPSITSPTRLSNLTGITSAVSSTSSSVDVIYGLKVTATDWTTGSSLDNRTGLNFDVFKRGDAVDIHIGRGIQGRVLDLSSTGRWGTAYGADIQVQQALNGYAMLASVLNSRGTSNTQYGTNVTLTTSGSGVTTSNAYGHNIVISAASSGAITNAYAFHNTSSVSGITNAYNLYNTTNWRNYLNGSLALGVNDNSAKLFIRGTGTTSSTYSIFAENSSGTDYFKLNDAGQLYLGSSTPNASAILQTDSTTMGFAPPRMTTTQRDAISTPLEGLEIYNTTTKGKDYYNGTRWIRMTQTTGTPTVTASTGYSAASATGNDLSGYVTFTSAGTEGTGKVVDFDFANAFPTSSNYTVMLSPKSQFSAIALLAFNISNIVVTGFDINFDATVVSPTITAGTHEFYYQIVQTN